MMETNQPARFGRPPGSLGATVLLIVLMILPLFTGCTTAAPDPTPKVNVIEREFKASPQDTLVKVRQAVAEMGVDEEQKGSIVSGWEAHRGDFHIARYWQERTRYRITVVPDWDTPDKRCRVQVVQETQQRAAEGQTWKPGAELNRNDRARAVLEKIAATMG